MSDSAGVQQRFLRIGNDDAALTLLTSTAHGEHSERWGLVAAVRLDGVEASTYVWLGPDGVQKPLKDYFRAMAESWAGWDGAMNWQAYEGGLSISSHNDRRGHISSAIVLTDYQRNW
jgi:hypothetical protein